MRLEILIIEKLEKLYLEGQYEKMFELIEALDDEDKTYSILIWRGIVYNRLGEYEKAIEALLAIKDEGEENYNWHYHMGWAYYNLEEVETALEYLKESEKLGATEDVVFLQIGLCLEELGRYDEELEYLRKAEATGEIHDNWLYYKLGTALVCNDKYEEALGYFKKCLEVGVENPWVYDYMGLCYTNLNQLEKALKALRKAEEITDHPRMMGVICLDLGTCLARLGRYQEGLEYLKKAKDLCATPEEVVNFNISMCLAAIENEKNDDEEKINWNFM